MACLPLRARAAGWLVARLAPDRLDNPRVLLAVWLITRTLLVVLMAATLARQPDRGDLAYYYTGMSHLAQAGPAETMPEYPTPVLWLMMVPWFLGGGHLAGFLAAFLGLMLALDAAVALTLWRGGGHGRGAAVLAWTVSVALMGHLPYERFDLVTSALAGWALLWVTARPAGGGALIGAGAALKLWPALLWPALCGRSRRQSLRATAGFLTTGGALALASLLWAGWDRLVAPLSWQAGRGLQIESVWASLPMLARHLAPGRYTIFLSPYKAFEIWGPGVHGLWLASGVATAAAYLLLGAVFVLWWRRGAGRGVEAGVLVLLVTVALIVTNKTLSPQYLLWLAGPLAATVAIVGASPTGGPSARADRHRLGRVLALVAAAAVLTMAGLYLGYPMAMSDLGTESAFFGLPTTLVLLARNGLLVWLFAVLARWTWQFLRPTAFAAVRAGRPVEDAAADSREDAAQGESHRPPG